MACKTTNIQQIQTQKILCWIILLKPLLTVFLNCLNTFLSTMLISSRLAQNPIFKLLLPNLWLFLQNQTMLSDHTSSHSKFRTIPSSHYTPHQKTEDTILKTWRFRNSVYCSQSAKWILPTKKGKTLNLAPVYSKKVNTNIWETQYSIIHKMKLRCLQYVQLFSHSIMSWCWVRPQDFIHITGHFSLSRGQGKKALVCRRLSLM